MALGHFSRHYKNVLALEIEVPWNLNTLSENWSTLQCLTGILHRMEKSIHWAKKWIWSNSDLWSALKLWNSTLLWKKKLHETFPMKIVTRLSLPPPLSHDIRRLLLSQPSEMLDKKVESEDQMRAKKVQNWRDTALGLWQWLISMADITQKCQPHWNLLLLYFTYI